jgi:hypothetical protein
MRATTQVKKAGEAPAFPNVENLPKLVPVDNVLAPAAPVEVEETGIDRGVLIDLILKLAYTVPSFTTEWVVQRLHLSLPLVRDLLEQLRQELMVDVLGQAGAFSYRYSIAQRGRDRASRALEISGYIGPAPVALEAYTALLEWQMGHFPRVLPDQVLNAVSDLVLPEETVQVAGMAVSSGRSLFIFGPPGNGKTSLGRSIHNALSGELWIPHCIGIDSGVIRIFDPHWHQPAGPLDQGWTTDQRWVRIRRPFIIVGGEATMESFELTHSPSLRFYEAPLHFKANGGTFLIDDFGRERMDPHELLNRWITPLEHKIDYLTLQTGQKIQVPFRQMLILATNLDPNTVMDPAFLRRMGYRLFLGNPTAEQYALIFERYANRKGTTAPQHLVARLIDRYGDEKRPFRACEPRDLIERANDFCQFRNEPLELTEKTLDIAWTGYFGNKDAITQGMLTE